MHVATILRKFSTVVIAERAIGLHTASDHFSCRSVPLMICGQGFSLFPSLSLPPSPSLHLSISPSLPLSLSLSVFGIFLISPPYLRKFRSTFLTLDPFVSIHLAFLTLPLSQHFFFLTLFLSVPLSLSVFRLSLAFYRLLVPVVSPAVSPNHKSHPPTHPHSAQLSPCLAPSFPLSTTDDIPDVISFSRN